MNVFDRITERNHTLFYSKYTLACGVGIALLAGALLFIVLQAMVDQPLFDELKGTFYVCILVMIVVGFILTSFLKRRIMIHQDGTVSIERYFLFRPFRRHYTQDEMFGLAVYEYDHEGHRKSEQEWTFPIYRIELVLMDGKRLTLISCGSREELGDCRRMIERFTGVPVAHKKYGGML